MASLNKVILLGNLTREPELRYTPGGAAVCEFGLAMNRRFVANGQDKEETCFVDVVVWGKQAESCGRFLEKGAQALVEGRLQLDQWEDRDSGSKRSRLRVVAERVQFMSRSRGADQDQQGGQYQQKGQYQQNQSYGQQAQAPYGQSQQNQPYGQQGNGGQYGGQQPKQQQYGAQQGQNKFPPMPEDAFNVGDDTEDDIPF
jgi:single-strand DNA-binding protein